MGRTGLPLRDISDAFGRLLQDDGPTGLRGRRWQIRAPFAYAVSLLLIVLLIAVGVSALRTQQSAYQAHLADIVAQQPLFADAMTANDGRWPVDAPYGTAGYANGSYVLTNKQYSAIGELQPATYGDVTLVVSVRQQSVGDYDNGDGLAGLVLRADPATDTYLTFGVRPDGYWELGSGPFSVPKLLDDGSNSAIQTGDGAVNTLAAIMRGNAYTLFINGQFIGTYLLAVPTHGRVGIFLDDTGQSGAFNDFAIYPTPPRSWGNWFFLA